MQKNKRFISGLLVLAMLFVSSTFILAMEGNSAFTDVAGGSWYAEAVQYVYDQGLMSGLNENTFAPDEDLSRAMLVTILYRSAGMPDVTGESPFTDVPAEQWYTNAVLWASNNEIVSGYDNGLFGTDDPVTREQLAVILWRYNGSPARDMQESASDNSVASPYALEAVNWARTLGVINNTGNIFDVAGNATRAEVAGLFHKLMADGDNSTSDAVSSATIETEEISDASGSKVLIAYFTRADNVDQQPDVDAVSRATFNPESDGIYGNTELIARYIQDTVDGDLFSIQATVPYPFDVDETIAEIRASGDPRTTLSTQVDNMDDYDVVFLGFPIFNATMPQPVISFLEEYDLSGKTVIPFSTHRGSGFGRSLSDLAALCPSATILDGLTVDGDSAVNAQAEVTKWLSDIGISE